MDKEGGIGFFDSGVGGLTIWKEVIELMPYESTIYIADSINAPYGVKSSEEILHLSRTHTQKLIDLGAKVIVVACNTATTQAIDALRAEFEIPFIGIEPAIKPAALASKTRSISVLATHGTIESDHFNRTKDQYTQDVSVRTQVGDGLVTAIENGELHSDKMRKLLSKHLNKLIGEHTDHLVLGCTHYPLLIPLIKELVNKEITIVDSGKPVAEQTKRMLIDHDLLTVGDGVVTHQLFSTGNKNILKSVVDELGQISGNVTYSGLYQSE